MYRMSKREPQPGVEERIGGRIRALREEAGLTVTALARLARLSKGSVSRIETGRVSPPISTFVRIAEALDVPLAELFLDTDSEPAYVLTRKGCGRITTRDGTRFGYSYEALALERRRKWAEPFLLTIRPGDPPGVFQHGGEEFIYMLSGRLEFSVGRDRFILGPGDALYFDPTVRHRTRLVGRRPARFLCVFVEGRGHFGEGRVALRGGTGRRTPGRRNG